jgi:thiol-disulfide isomerase/thioredoxin
VNRTVLLIVLVAIAGALGGAWVGGQLAPGRSRYVQDGDAFIDASLPSLDGGIRKLSDYAGQPVLLNFWATWCGPCVDEMPLLDAMQREVGEGALRIVGIAQDDPAAVADMLKRVPVSYPILLDEPGPNDLSVRYGNVRNVLPYSVLIDASGRIVAQRAGSFDRDALEAWIARIR